MPVKRGLVSTVAPSKKAVAPSKKLCIGNFFATATPSPAVGEKTPIIVSSEEIPQAVQEREPPMQPTPPAAQETMIPPLGQKGQPSPTTATTHEPSPEIITGSPLPSPSSPQSLAPFPELGHDPAHFDQVMREMNQELQALTDQAKKTESVEQGETPADGDKDDKAKKALEQAIADGDVLVTSGLGQKFRRECAKDKSLKIDYSKLQTDLQRKQFRLDLPGCTRQGARRS